jgi:hypothetical protein
MLRPIPILTMLILAGGCAAVKQNVSEPVEVTTVIPSITPSFIQGDRVYHAEMAKDIAEYVLVLEGVDCRDLKAQVSFCDGIYTVAFCREDRQLTNHYWVDIDADTSKILSVKKTRTRLAAAM